MAVPPEENPLYDIPATLNDATVSRLNVLCSLAQVRFDERYETLLRIDELNRIRVFVESPARDHLAIPRDGAYVAVQGQHGSCRSSHSKETSRHLCGRPTANAWRTLGVKATLRERLCGRWPTAVPLRKFLRPATGTFIWEHGRRRGTAL